MKQLGITDIQRINNKNSGVLNTVRRGKYQNNAVQAVYWGVQMLKINSVVTSHSWQLFNSNIVGQLISLESASSFFLESLVHWRWYPGDVFEYLKYWSKISTTTNRIQSFNLSVVSWRWCLECCCWMLVTINNKKEKLL